MRCASGAAYGDGDFIRQDDPSPRLGHIREVRSFAKEVIPLGLRPDLISVMDLVFTRSKRDPPTQLSAYVDVCVGQKIKRDSVLGVQDELVTRSRDHFVGSPFGLRLRPVNGKLKARDCWVRQ